MQQKHLPIISAKHERWHDAERCSESWEALFGTSAAKANKTGLSESKTPRIKGSKRLVASIKAS